MLSAPELRGLVNDRTARRDAPDLLVLAQGIANERACLRLRQVGRATEPSYIPFERLAPEYKPLAEVIERLRHAGLHREPFVLPRGDVEADADEAHVGVHLGRSPGNALCLVILRR